LKVRATHLRPPHSRMRECASPHASSVSQAIAVPLGTSTNAPRLCFIHVPKCAGGALHLALRRHYGLIERHHLSAIWSRRFASWQNTPLRSYRLALLEKRLSSPRLRYVSGHYPITLELLEKHEAEWHFLTVLRPPVERWLSNYFFNRYKSKRHFRTRANLADYLASSPGRASARTYLRHFGGWQPQSEYRTLCRARMPNAEPLPQRGRYRKAGPSRKSAGHRAGWYCSCGEAQPQSFTRKPTRRARYPRATGGNCPRVRRRHSHLRARKEAGFESHRWGAGAFVMMRRSS